MEIMLTTTHLLTIPQELVQVTDETLTVKSTSFISGYTQNKTELVLSKQNG